MMIAAWILLALQTGDAKEADYATSVFDDTKIHSIHIIISGDDYAKIGRKPFAWVKGDVEVDGEKFGEVAIREKGNSSAGIRSDKKPFKIDFAEYRKDQRCHGLKMLVLNNGFKDPSLLREKLAYDLFRAAGCPASRAAHAMVYITAEGKFQKQYFGLYTMVEHVDEVFLDERFGGHDGNLYKPEGMQDLFTKPDEKRIQDEKAVELKTNTTTNDRSRLVAFAKAVADGADLSKWLDVDSMLKWIAVTSALCNLDSYAGTGHNYYLYDDPKTGKFVVLPWDLNEAFGNFQMGPADDLLEWDIFAPYAGKKLLIERVLAVAANRTKYAAILKSLCEKEFSTKAMNARIDALHKLTLDAATKDAKKEQPTETLVKSISTDIEGNMGPKNMKVFGLKPFVERRRASILAQLGGKKGKALQGGMGGPGMGPKPPGPNGDPVKDMDKDGDGKVSRKEWRGPADDFDRFDKNGDGQLDGEELRKP